MRSFRVAYKTKIIIIIGIVVTIAILAGIYIARRHTNNPNTFKLDPSIPTASELINADQKATDSSLKAKNYSAAAGSCSAAASTAYSTNNENGARTILEDCIKRIPQEETPWDIYEFLGRIDNDLKDKAGAFKNYQIALKKLQAKPSPDTATSLKFVQQRVQELSK